MEIFPREELMLSLEQVKENIVQYDDQNNFGLREVAESICDTAKFKAAQNFNQFLEYKRQQRS